MTMTLHSGRSARCGQSSTGISLLGLLTQRWSRRPSRRSRSVRPSAEPLDAPERTPWHGKYESLGWTTIN